GRLRSPVHLADDLALLRIEDPLRELRVASLDDDCCVSHDGLLWNEWLAVFACERREVLAGTDGPDTASRTESEERSRVDCNRPAVHDLVDAAVVMGASGRTGTGSAWHPSGFTKHLTLSDPLSGPH